MSESPVTAMCTPGDDSVLICGTTEGSLTIFDLSDFNTNESSELNYEALLKYSLGQETAD